MPVSEQASELSSTAPTPSLRGDGVRRRRACEVMPVSEQASELSSTAVNELASVSERACEVMA
jgi:hypothetical protein